MINFFKRLFGIHIHAWGKWERIDVMISEGFFEPTYEYTETRQVRRCDTCGLTKTKTFR